MEQCWEIGEDLYIPPNVAFVNLYMDEKVAKVRSREHVI